MRSTRSASSLALLMLTLAFGFAMIAGSSDAWAASRPDPWITFKTKIALLTTEGLDAMDVNVDTVRGMVTLHGTVDTDAEKASAEKVAKGIEGAQGVRNLLQVEKNPKAEEVREDIDADTQKSVESALAADRSLSDSGVRVASVNKGVVLLTGIATSVSDQLRAIQIARGVPGARHVASEIEGPSDLYDEEIWYDGAMRGQTGNAQDADASWLSDTRITMETKLGLIANEQTPALEISVDTRDGVVTLFGAVPSDVAKKAAEVETRKVGGVKDVHNDLQVVPPSKKEMVEMKDELIDEAITTAIRVDADLAGVDVEVRNGVARLTGKVPSQIARLNAAVVARSVAGVRSVANDLEVKRSS